MTDTAQAKAYATADFSVPHTNIVRRFQQAFPALPQQATVVDLGCGPADITIRIAKLNRHFSIDAIDGSSAMLNLAKEMIAKAGLATRIHLLQTILPDLSVLSPAYYDVAVSNSLLHHLHNPQVLWQTIKVIAKPGARVFIADLRRPNSKQDAIQIVQKHAANEPAILQRDFHNSLLAAFTLQELRDQITIANLNFKVEPFGDYHVSISGTLKAS